MMSLDHCSLGTENKSIKNTHVGDLSNAVTHTDSTYTVTPLLASVALSKPLYYS